MDGIRSADDVERFWQLAILIGLRDKAERLEVRFTESGAILYHRVDGRDWELTPVDEELSPQLTLALQSVARLIAPERPALEVFAPPEGSRYEQPQVGWLSCQLRTNWLDSSSRLIRKYHGAASRSISRAIPIWQVSLRICLPITTTDRPFPNCHEFHREQRA
jgi:hypothetical protein